MITIQSSISSKYQTVIPVKIRNSLKITAGDKLIWRLIRVENQTKAITEPEPKSWASYSRGLGKHIWKKC